MCRMELGGTFVERDLPQYEKIKFAPYCNIGIGPPAHPLPKAASKHYHTALASTQPGKQNIMVAWHWVCVGPYL